MNDWLPSLNALRAFEAVCRHLNYAHASEELRVTPAAVKQLVRKLEDTLGTRLVERSGRGLALTAAGRSGFDGLSSGFTQIGNAVSRMRSHTTRQSLIVSVEPSFATAWLVPRLERFRLNHADVDVLIESSLRLVDLDQGPADIAVRFGATQYGDSLVTSRLFDEQLCVFCSPSLKAGRRKLAHLDDLKHVTLLHWDLSDLTWASATKKWMGWQPWLAMVGAKYIDHRSGVRFSDYNLAVQAAIAGQGVVLGSLPVLGDLVKAGLLVCPFAERVDTDIGYDIIATERALERSEVRSFMDWIIVEARAENSGF